MCHIFHLNLWNQHCFLISSHMDNFNLHQHIHVDIDYNHNVNNKSLLYRPTDYIISYYT